MMNDPYFGRSEQRVADLEQQRNELLAALEQAAMELQEAAVILAAANRPGTGNIMSTASEAHRSIIARIKETQA